LTKLYSVVPGMVQSKSGGDIAIYSFKTYCYLFQALVATVYFRRKPSVGRPLKWEGLRSLFLEESCFEVLLVHSVDVLEA
jgi:hypothetical protein